MKNLIIKSVIGILFATFLITACQRDPALTKLTKQKPTTENTTVVQTDTGVIAVTDLTLMGRYAYYDSLTVDSVWNQPREIGSTGVSSGTGYFSYTHKGKFKGYVNIYSAKLPVVGGLQALEVTFATTYNLLEQGDSVVEPITPAGPYKVTLVTTDEFLIGQSETGKKPDSLYVLKPETLKNPPASALEPPAKNDPPQYTPIFENGKQ